MKGIQELLYQLCNFFINLKLFQNKKVFFFKERRALKVEEPNTVDGPGLDPGLNKSIVKTSLRQSGKFEYGLDVR